MEKSCIQKEISNNVKSIPLSLILSDIKENKFENKLNSKIILSKFYKANNYPVYSHYKSILRY